MEVWRIAKAAYCLDLSGKGAAIVGGRWNLRDTPALYAGLSVEIAALEKLVHEPTHQAADLVLVKISLPDDESLVRALSLDELPDDWSATPAPPSTAKLGNALLTEMKWLAFTVPSAVIPEARNIVINPLHPAARRLEIARVRDFVFDERIFNKR